MNGIPVHMRVEQPGMMYLPVRSMTCAARRRSAVGGNRPRMVLPSDQRLNDRGSARRRSRR